MKAKEIELWKKKLKFWKIPKNSKTYKRIMTLVKADGKKLLRLAKTKYLKKLESEKLTDYIRFYEKGVREIRWSGTKPELESFHYLKKRYKKVQEKFKKLTESGTYLGLKNDLHRIRKLKGKPKKIRKIKERMMKTRGNKKFFNLLRQLLQMKKNLKRFEELYQRSGWKPKDPFTEKLLRNLIIHRCILKIGYRR